MALDAGQFGLNNRNKSLKSIMHSAWGRSYCCDSGLVTQSCTTSVTPWTVPTRLLCPQHFPGKNTGVGCRFLLQGIFPTQGLNLGLLHCRQSPALQADFLPTESSGTIPANSTLCHIHELSISVSEFALTISSDCFSKGAMHY